MAVASWFSPTTSAPEWMPWPVAGYSSVALEPGGRWSLSSSRPTDFGQARVTVTGPDGRDLAVRQHPSAEGYGLDTLVWEVLGLPAVDTLVADRTYRVTVSGIRREGAAIPDLSYDVTLVPGRPAQPTQGPAIEGASAEGEWLHPSLGTLHAAGYHVLGYQWLRDGVPIRGADEYHYLTTRADAGSRITLRLAVGRARYANGTVDSAAVRIPARPPAPRRFTIAARPAVVGKAQVGRALTARPGTWRPAPTRVTYQWYRGGTRIKGANSATLKVGRAYRGATLRCAVTGRRAGYTTATLFTPSVRVR